MDEVLFLDVIDLSRPSSNNGLFSILRYCPFRFSLSKYTKKIARTSSTSLYSIYYLVFTAFALTNAPRQFQKALNIILSNSSANLEILIQTTSELFATVKWRNRLRMTNCIVAIPISVTLNLRSFHVLHIKLISSGQFLALGPSDCKHEPVMR